MFARVKVQSLRTMLWLGNAIVILAIAGLLAVIVINFKKHKGDFTPFDTALVKKKMETKPSIDPGVDDAGRGQIGKYATIWDLNITGREIEEVSTNQAPTEVKAAVPAIAEELGIEMVVTASEATARFVEVRYKKQEAPVPTATPSGARGVQASLPAAAGATAGATAPSERVPPKVAHRLLNEGDALADPYDKAPYNAKVVQIASDEVIFSWGGKEEALPVPKLDDVEYAPPRVLPGDPNVPGYTPDEFGGGDAEASKPEFDPKVSRKIDDNTWFIGADEKARVKSDYEKLWAEVEWTTQRHKEDKKQYLKIAKIPEGSLAKDRGLEEGDMLRSINGRDVFNRASVFQYFQENPGFKTYRVEIERRGQRQTRVFQVAD